MPRYSFELRELFPHAFAHYRLPLLDVPVLHRGAEIDRVTIPKSGKIECELTPEALELLRTGMAAIRPKSQGIVREGTARLVIHNLEIVDTKLGN